MCGKPPSPQRAGSEAARHAGGTRRADGPGDPSRGLAVDGLPLDRPASSSAALQGPAVVAQAARGRPAGGVDAGDRAEAHAAEPGSGELQLGVLAQRRGELAREPAAHNELPRAGQGLGEVEALLDAVGARLVALLDAEGVFVAHAAVGAELRRGRRAGRVHDHAAPLDRLELEGERKVVRSGRRGGRRRAGPPQVA